jgi:hypothetical protein
VGCKIGDGRGWDLVRPQVNLQHWVGASCRWGSPSTAFIQYQGSDKSRPAPLVQSDTYGPFRAQKMCLVGLPPTTGCAHIGWSLTSTSADRENRTPVVCCIRRRIHCGRQPDRHVDFIEVYKPPV